MTCRFCGLDQEAHRPTTVYENGGPVTRLMLNGHLFVALSFPLSGQMSALAPAKGEDEMWSVLKAAALESFSVEELVAGLRFGKDVLEEYLSLGLDAPAWLEKRVTALQVAIRRRGRDELEKALEAARKEQDVLKTTDEKRKEVNDRILLLEDKLKTASAL